jgi:protoporphyrinogen IX oxidase
MSFLYLKALHIIFIVTWFAGIFYMPRLFVYIIEANEKSEPEKTILRQQLLIMASRLWFGITWPSAIITLIVGVSLLIAQPAFLGYTFMHIKLALVFVLYLYHFSLHSLLGQLKRGVVKYTSQQMRIWNEVSTLLLISIVFLIVVKTALSLAWGVAGPILLSLLIMTGIRIYKKLRND